MKRSRKQTNWIPPQEPDEQSLLIDANTVAKQLGCCTKTVYKLAKDHKIKSRPIGRLRKFKQQDVLDFIENSQGETDE
ncbi:helix-turn-helix domain-containing protein [Planctomycetota bacterium]|nr:helix-turn-helix domain-containing protein [Planctomycetota bacterium]